MTISVVGMSMLGIASAAVMAKAGYSVLCTDMDEEIVNAVKEGDLPGYEKDMESVVAFGIESGCLEFCGNTRKVIKEGQAIFITCEVPEDDENMPDLRFVKAIARSIGNQMEDYKAVIIKAPTPPGTVEIVEDIIADCLDERVLDIPFDVITSPSIARTGSMMRDLERPKLVAVGTNSARGKEEITEIYRKMAIVTNKIVYGTPRDVEMAYYGLSGMLAVKVAYINEMALICEKMDANIEVVSKIIGMDSRISSQILNPGPGFGGSHLPKSARLLARMAEKCGESMKTLEGTITANEKQKMKSVEKIVTILDGVKDKTIAIIGLATKPGTDDLREAPSLDVVKSLAEQGAVLRVYSPEGYQQAKWRFFSVSEALTYCDTIYDAAEGADALVIMTKWNNTRATDENLLAEKMNGRVMIDLQNLFINRHEIKRLFDYHGIGINEKYKGFKIEHES